MNESFSSCKAELVCTIEIWNTTQWTFKTRQWHFLSFFFFGLQVLSVLILTPIYLRKAVKDTFSFFAFCFCYLVRIWLYQAQNTSQMWFTEIFMASCIFYFFPWLKDNFRSGDQTVEFAMKEQSGLSDDVTWWTAQKLQLFSLKKTQK